MAERPVFLPSRSGSSLVSVVPVSFAWHPGLSVQQARKSIASLHEATRQQLHVSSVLEISSKSEDPIGVELSAFNLTLASPDGRKTFSVECAFQSSKVFERGGPYEDLLAKSSRDAKTDQRLKESGPLVKFRFFACDWSLEPRTAFYDWLYIQALHRHPRLAEHVLTQEAFTDIVFNPQKSLNCQARAAALYVTLARRGLLTSGLLSDQHAYLELVATGA